jgi:alpha-1,2-mannosyltransferase
MPGKAGWLAGDFPVTGKGRKVHCCPIVRTDFAAVFDFSSFFICPNLVQGSTPMSIRSLWAYLHRSADTWFVLLLLLFFAGLSVQYYFKATHLRGDGSQTRTAILRWKDHLESVTNGDESANDAAYPNPPIMAILLSPLARLNPLPMALTWFYLKVAMALVCLFAVFRMVAGNARPFPVWAKGLTVLLAIRPIIGDLQHGNVNLFILFLMVMAFFAYQRGRGVVAGLTLGLAIACKMTPALFIPYFLWKRSWRALAGCLAGVVLFLWPGVVPALVLGADENQHQLRQWYECMVVPYTVEHKVWSEHNNQSLVGVVYRLTTHSPSASTYDENKQYVPTEYANVWDLDRTQAHWLVVGCELLFAGMAVWCCRTPLAPPTGWRLNAEFAIVTLGMLLFSERTWKHHCVTLLLPFAVLCYHLATAKPSRWQKALSGTSLATVALLMTLPSLAGANDFAIRLALRTGSSFALAAAFRLGPLCETVAKLSEVYGVYAIGYLILLAALVVVLRKARNGEGAANGRLPNPDGAIPKAA